MGILINKRSVIIILISIELMLLAININFIIFSAILDDFIGQLFALFVLTIAAAESAVGLAILVIFFRVRSSISINTLLLIHGLFLGV